MRRVDTVCDEFSGSKKATRTSGEQIHLPKEVGQEHMKLLIFAVTFHHRLPQIDLVEPSQVQDVTLHQVVVARTNYHCLDIVYFVGPNQ